MWNWILKILPYDTIAKYIIKFLTKADDKYVDALWQKAVNVVEKLAKEANLPGEQKRKLAEEELRKQAQGITDFIINLAIELAVAKIKQKVNQK